MPLEKPNVLLTGASGFLGLEMLSQLARDGYPVLAMCNRRCSRLDERVGQLEAEGAAPVYRLHYDISKPEAHEPGFWRDILQGGEGRPPIGAIINGASIIVEKGQATFEAVNLYPAAALATAAAETGVRRFIHISTMAADLPDWRAHGYARTKKQIEAMLQGMDAALDWVVVRPSILFHETGWGHTLSMDQLASLPLTPVIGSGDQPFDPIHLADAARLVQLVHPQSPVNHAILNAVGPERQTVNAIIAAIRDDLGRPYRPIHLPADIAEAWVEQLPIGVANPGFMHMLAMAGREKPHYDPTAFCEAVGLTHMRRLSETLARARAEGLPTTHFPVDAVRQVMADPGRFVSALAAATQATLEYAQKQLTGKGGC